MKTNQLIDILAREAGPAPRAVVFRRLVLAGLFGLLSSSLLALLMIGPLPTEILYGAPTWLKLTYALAVVLSAGLLTGRLAKPLARVRIPRALLIGSIGAMLLIGLLALILTPTDARLAAILGKTWLQCPWALMGFSLPALAGILWALRGLAPIQAEQTGWAAGLPAGALGAMGYALACPESSSTFVAIWYTIGILMTGAIGRFLGPLVLRW